MGVAGGPLLTQFPRVTLVACVGVRLLHPLAGLQHPDAGLQHADALHASDNGLPASGDHSADDARGADHQGDHQGDHDDDSTDHNDNGTDDHEHHDNEENPVARRPQGQAGLRRGVLLVASPPAPLPAVTDDRPAGEVVVVLDAQSHPADAIQRAAYRFSDRFSMALERDGENYRCLLTFPAEPDPSVVGAFESEVLDQVLRARIRAETEGVRNLILSVAFSHLTGGTEA